MNTFFLWLDSLSVPESFLILILEFGMAWLALLLLDLYFSSSIRGDE